MFTSEIELAVELYKMEVRGKTGITYKELKQLLPDIDLLKAVHKGIDLRLIDIEYRGDVKHPYYKMHVNSRDFILRVCLDMGIMKIVIVGEET